MILTVIYVLCFYHWEQRSWGNFKDILAISVVPNDNGSISEDNTGSYHAILSRKNLGCNIICRGHSRDKRGRIEHLSALCLIIDHVATISKVDSLPVLSQRERCSDVYIELIVGELSNCAIIIVPIKYIVGRVGQDVVMARSGCVLISGVNSGQGRIDESISSVKEGVHHRSILALERGNDLSRILGLLDVVVLVPISSVHEIISQVIGPIFNIATIGIDSDLQESGVV